MAYKTNPPKTELGVIKAKEIERYDVSIKEIEDATGLSRQRIEYIMKDLMKKHGKRQAVNFFVGLCMVTKEKGIR